jgi:hypothetical protein
VSHHMAQATSCCPAMESADANIFTKGVTVAAL